MLVNFSLLLLSSASDLPSSKKYIVSGALWKDTNGDKIDAHGGGIVKANDTFYWIGGSIGCCGGTNLYSSPDLVTWTNHGTVYSDNISRPKLVFSSSDGLWHIFGQVGRQLIIASSSSILGPYTTQVEPFSPLGVNFTDFGLFLDADGSAYALYSADHNNDVISLIDPSRTNITTLVHQFSAAGLESPGMFKMDDTYYFIASHKTAYLYNNDVVYSAQNLTGQWSVQSYIAPFGTRTWNSQNTFELTIHGTEGSFVMYMGDRWVFPDLQNSTYVWLPIQVDKVKKAVSLEWHDVWAVDVEKGTISVPEGKKYEAEHGTVTGDAYAAVCPTCSGNQIVTNIRGPSNLTLHNIAGSGSEHWVSFHYINTDGLFGDLTVVDADTLSLVKQRNATVSVNNRTPVPLAQYDTNAGIVMSVPLLLQLDEGDRNNITITSVGNQFAGDLDYIIVY